MVTKDPVEHEEQVEKVRFHGEDPFQSSLPSLNGAAPCVVIRGVEDKLQEEWIRPVFDEIVDPKK